jgi:hypothetical protein
VAPDPAVGAAAGRAKAREEATRVAAIRVAVPVPAAVQAVAELEARVVREVRAAQARISAPVTSNSTGKPVKLHTTLCRRHLCLTPPVEYLADLRR